MPAGGGLDRDMASRATHAQSGRAMEARAMQGL